jgi:hypothetical protein
MTRCSVIEYKPQHKLLRLKQCHTACKQETADTHTPSVYTPQTLHTHTRRQHPTGWSHTHTSAVWTTQCKTGNRRPQSCRSSVKATKRELLPRAIQSKSYTSRAAELYTHKAPEEYLPKAAHSEGCTPQELYITLIRQHNCNTCQVQLQPVILQPTRLVQPQYCTASHRTTSPHSFWQYHRLWQYHSKKGRRGTAPIHITPVPPYQKIPRDRDKWHLRVDHSRHRPPVAAGQQPMSTRCHCVHNLSTHEATLIGSLVTACAWH